MKNQLKPFPIISYWAEERIKVKKSMKANPHKMNRNQLNRFLKVNKCENELDTCYFCTKDIY